MCALRECVEGSGAAGQTHSSRLLTCQPAQHIFGRPAQSSLQRESGAESRGRLPAFAFIADRVIHASMQARLGSDNPHGCRGRCIHRRVLALLVTAEPRFSLVLSTSELLIAEIHACIRKLGGTAEPVTPEDAWLDLCSLGADAALRSVVANWWAATLDDEQVLVLLRDWNAGQPAPLR